MAVQIKRTPSGGGQTDISSSISWDTITLTLVLTKQVSTLTFNVDKDATHVIPLVGDTIDVYEDQTSGSVHIFGGTVTESELTVIGGIRATYAITVTDWSFKFDAKAVAKTYTNMDAGDIVRDIITNFTSGFTDVNVQSAGFNIPSIKFNYQPPTKCLEKIANMIGWGWYIDATKDVHFFLTDTSLAPFPLDDTSGNLEWPTIDFDVSIQNLKNSIFVIGGTYLRVFDATSTSDVYTTVAGTVTYPLAYSYSPDTIAATKDGVSLSIGIDQKDNPASFDALYNAGQGGVGAFLLLSNDPGNGHVLKVFGSASIPILGAAIDAGSIATYGEFQDTVIDKQITTIAEAQARAQAEIDQYGAPTYTLKFNTIKTGLYIGQTITLTSSLLGITQTFAINRITGVSYTPTVLEYQVECYATNIVDYLNIMTLLLEQELNQNQVADSTILEILIGVREAITLADAATITTSSGPYKWGAMTWGFFTWGP